ncbi:MULTISPECIES: alpha/beta fold hydrolase [Streptomyces]|uniref:Alpha/beta fold hydrolase n=2 Tax=Streptomyces TaxID=1883 RepID=A0ABV9IL55_9ACTN
MSRRTALCTALALAVLPLTAPAATAAGSTGGGDPLTRFHQQRPAWQSCVRGPDDATGEELEKAGAECADITVPLDYADPGGRTITVAVSRIRATDTAHRVGPLLLNGGGPGGQSLGDPPWVRKAMKDVAARYDVVGVDPRFVGRSTPLDCGWPTGTLIRGAGADRAGFDRMTEFARDLATRCRTNAGPVLPYATTRNTARDMDVVRAALGERRISYLGYSYGSYLGEVYATMFPGRVDRMVLDGVIDPARYSPRLLRGAETENRLALEDWASWTAARHGKYGLGRTRDAVLKAVDRVRSAATRAPLALGSYRVDEHTVPVVVFSSLSQDNDEAYGNLARAVRDMRRAAQGHPVDPDPVLAETLKFVLTDADSAYGSVQSAILCGDVAAPRDPEVYWRDIQRTRAREPLFAPITRNIGPCAFWDPPREAPTTVRDDFPALLVNATGDPRTTYAGAVAQHGDWPASRLITLRGPAQHAVYGVYGSTCVDTKVNAYLATGHLPTEDTTCDA